jgi:DNA-binding transcriptional LysR family regulator
MNNLDWDDLRYFLAAARSGSLSAASRELGSNQPTVGRRIAALEQVLGFRLFQRHPHGLTLTEDGQRILEAATAMDDLAAGLARVMPQEGELGGTVRVAAPEGLAVALITPALAGFARAHPALDLVVQPAVTSADLVRGEADVAIRLYRPEVADLVIRRLRVMEFGLYAAEEYLSRYGVPRKLEELRAHRFISYGPQLQGQEDNIWLLSMVPDARMVFRSDSTLTRLAAAEAGFGIAVLPHMVAGDRLQRVLPGVTAPAREIWLVVHRDLKDIPRVRAVMEFLSEVIEGSNQ